MVTPGEYNDQLVRTTRVQCPVVSGYVTARLQVQGNPEISISGFVQNTTQVAVRNSSTNTVTFQLQQCDDYVSGPREYVGAAVTLVPHGRTAYSVTARQMYLEVQGQSGTGAIDMQLSSRLKWDEMAFAKTDPYYPPFLYTAKSPLTTAV